MVHDKGRAMIGGERGGERARSKGEQCNAMKSKKSNLQQAFTFTYFNATSCLCLYFMAYVVYLTIFILYFCFCSYLVLLNYVLHSL